MPKHAAWPMQIYMPPHMTWKAFCCRIRCNWKYKKRIAVPEQIQRPQVPLHRCGYMLWLSAMWSGTTAARFEGRHSEKSSSETMCWTNSTLKKTSQIFNSSRHLHKYPNRDDRTLALQTISSCVFKLTMSSWTVKMVQRVDLYTQLKFNIKMPEKHLRMRLAKSITNV